MFRKCLGRVSDNFIKTLGRRYGMVGKGLGVRMRYFGHVEELFRDCLGKCWEVVRPSSGTC